MAFVYDFAVFLSFLCLFWTGFILGSFKTRNTVF